MTPLPIHVGPGVDAARLGKVLAELALEPVGLMGAQGPDGAAPYLVGAETLRSREPLNHLLRNAAVVVLHPAGSDPPEGWDADAVWVPVDAPVRVLGGSLHLARENVALRIRVGALERGDVRARERMAEVNRIGIALSSERDMDTLQDLILHSCRQITNADAATLYLVEESEDGHRMLRFAWSQTHSVDVPFSTFKMPLIEKSIAGFTVLSGRAQVVEDAYNLPVDVPFGFNGSFDEQHGYRTRSMLCVPMRNHDGEIVGAIQLINAKRMYDTRLTPSSVEREVIPFENDHLDLIQSIASQAAVAPDNKNPLDAIQNLFDAFVKASVPAIQPRHPTTHGPNGRPAATPVVPARARTDAGRGVPGPSRDKPPAGDAAAFAVRPHHHGPGHPPGAARTTDGKAVAGSGGRE